MTTWFIYNNIDSREMGVISQQYPAPARGAEQVKDVPTPGRYETLHKRPGDYNIYERLGLEMDIAIIRGGDPSQVLQWLRGDGEIILGNAPDYMRHVWLTDELALERWGRGGEIWTGTLKMEGAPWREVVNESPIIIARRDVVINDGNFECYPIITIEGSGTCELTMGDDSLSMTGIVDGVTLDCAAKIAVADNVSVSGIVTGDWPVLEPGAHDITWSGTVSRIIVAPRRRYI